MAFNKDLIKGFTQANLGAGGTAPAIYTVKYEGPSADWKKSASLTTYLKSRGVAAGDSLVLACTVGDLYNICLLHYAGADLEVLIMAKTPL